MPRVRSGDLTVAVIAVAALAVVAAAGVFVSPRDEYTAGRGSSYSAAPDGAKAVFIALKQVGYAVERSFEPITAITGSPAATTLVIASPTADFSQQDRRALRQFVEGGGIVLATGAGGATVLGAKATQATGALSIRRSETFSRVAASPLSAGASDITMEGETFASFGEEYLPVYGPEHAPVVRSARLGSGRAIWWADSTPLTNRAVADRGNLALLLNALGGPGRRVLWDEHYHGHARSLWSYAKATPLPWAAAQALLVALAAALTFSRRREPVRPPVTDSRTSPMEFVETVGGLYERAGAASAAVLTARARLRRMLVSACGVAAATADERVARAAAGRIGMDAGALSDLLARAARDARNLSLRSDEALPIVRELQAAAAKVMAARQGSQGGRPF